MIQWSVATVTQGVAFYSLPVLLFAIFVAFIRLLRGPSAADRVLALDIMSILSAGVLGIYAIDQGEILYLDVATVVVLVSFLATVAFARYLAKPLREDKE